MKNKTAFIAGASSGLGLAATEALLREGCNVAPCSRNRGRIDAAAVHLGNSEKVLPVVCDVTNEAHIEAAIDSVVAHFGGLNIIVTNAGGPPTGYVGDFDAKTWRRGLDLNLVSTINMCRHALPHLKRAAVETGLARILMVTSIAAKQPIPSLYLSNTARAGVQGFAKTLSEEVGPSGITVNTILPGFTRTARLRHLVDDIQTRTGQTAEEIEAEWAAGAALKRLAEPGEFAAVAAFLCSARASYITGCAIPVCGGYSKHVF